MSISVSRRYIFFANWNNSFFHLPFVKGNTTEWYASLIHLPYEHVCFTFMILWSEKSKRRRIWQEKILKCHTRLSKVPASFMRGFFFFCVWFSNDNGFVGWSCRVCSSSILVTPGRTHKVPLWKVWVPVYKFYKCLKRSRFVDHILMGNDD